MWILLILAVLLFKDSIKAILQIIVDCKDALKKLLEAIADCLSNAFK